MSAATVRTLLSVLSAVLGAVATVFSTQSPPTITHACIGAGCAAAAGALAGAAHADKPGTAARLKRAAATGETTQRTKRPRP